MTIRLTEISVVVCMVFICFGCGGRQEAPAHIETRPLEEGKAFTIIEDILAERGYTFEKEVGLQVARGIEFGADFKVSGEGIAVEYLTKADRSAIGELPPPGEGSRLHVVNGRTIATQDGVPSRVFILFIDDRKFVYHSNPTSKVRADVTFLEVDSRLRRDVSDFLSWYEDSKKK
jgi:hypothetical protein